jgi:hypothetical protein
MSIDETSIEEQSKQFTTLVPFKIISNPRKLETPIRISSKPVTLVQVTEIIEYLNRETGEIIPAKQVHAAQGRPIDLSLRVLQREHLLNSLREEVREFAFYVLSFRNRRRGITPGIERLVKWYAEATHRRTDNVRRYVPKLEQAGILASEFLLCPLFQLSGKNTQARDHLSEDFRADLMRLRWLRRLCPSLL